MLKTDGKLHAAIVERLRAEGLATNKVEVATLGRGPDHLILLDGVTIGEYNHKSKKLMLYGSADNVIQE